MRVLLLHSELGVLRGGGENFTRNLFTAFAARGHHVTAAFVANIDGEYPISLPASITAVPIRGRWSRKLGQSSLSAVRSHIPFNGRFGKELDRVQEALSWRTVRWHERRFERRIQREFAGHWNRFDVVYVHGSVTLARKIAQHRPTILRLPGPVDPTLAPMLRQIQAVCANGDALSRLREFIANHAIELPIGLDERTFAPGTSSVRGKIGWTEQHRVIGYVGRLTAVKGIDLLASAFREVSKTVPDARLLIVGSGEEEGAIRSELVREIECGKVHLERDVDHQRIPEWYRAMDLLVMPSRYENFSNALIEAMACGIPFVASDIGGNKMLAETGGGWFFEAGSSAALQGLLHKVISNIALIRERGAVAERYARKRYSWEHTAECLEQIIKSRLRPHEAVPGWRQDTSITMDMKSTRE